jgi:hypothetical protein
MFSGASYTTAAFLQDSGLKRPFIITSDTGVLLGISEVGQVSKCHDLLTWLWKITIFNGKIHYFYGHFQ